MTARQSMKAFCLDEAARCGVSPKGVWTRIRRGTYDAVIVLHRLNARVVDVEVKPGAVMPNVVKGSGHLRSGRWGLTTIGITHAEYMRRWRALRKQKVD